MCVFSCTIQKIQYRDKDIIRSSVPQLNSVSAFPATDNSAREIEVWVGDGLVGFSVVKSRGSPASEYLMYTVPWQSSDLRPASKIAVVSMVVPTVGSVYISRDREVTSGWCNVMEREGLPCRSQPGSLFYCWSGWRHRWTSRNSYIRSNSGLRIRRWLRYTWRRGGSPIWSFGRPPPLYNRDGTIAKVSDRGCVYVRIQVYLIDCDLSLMP